MNGYKVFYRGRTAEIYADTTRAAQLKAAALWRVKPGAVYLITAMLCETADGGQVIHAAID
jgi:hypothetical protein